MAQKLKESERLIRAGYTALRAPDGKPLPPIPYYFIVLADKADPAAVVELRDDEWLVEVGFVLDDLQSARERYAALKAGRKVPPPDERKPIYIVEDATNINTEMGLSEGEAKFLDDVSRVFADKFKEYVKNGGMISK